MAKNSPLNSVFQSSRGPYIQCDVPTTFKLLILSKQKVEKT